MRYLQLHSRDRYPDFKTHPRKKILDEVRVRYRVGSQKRRKAKELFEKVPSLQEVQKLNFQVEDFLNKDLEEQVLYFKELSLFNFLILSFRLNYRAGPLLNLTWRGVAKIKKQAS